MMTLAHTVGIDRRSALQSAACGFGALALAAMSNTRTLGKMPDREMPRTAPRARRVIFIFMQGGPSHIDSFDYKPELFRRDGAEIDFTGVRFGDFGQQTRQTLMKPLWPFRQHGETGKWVSALFPAIAQCVDEICFLQGMHTTGVAHGPATLFLHSGATNLVRPSVGAWISYGLGAETDDLPAFVTLSPSAANGGPRNYAHAFLPARHQGTVLGRAGHPARAASFRHLVPSPHATADPQRQYEYLRRLHTIHEHKYSIGAPAGLEDGLAAAIEAHELAFRMQARARPLLEVADETSHTLRRYGIDQRATEDFGYQCLMARRLAEAGVRYIQINYADNTANPRWDQHADMPQHAIHARATDLPVAALLTDLHARGLLDDTLVWWGGEFGRTPFSQNKTGRDHNPRGFTMFLAGGGVKPGICYGNTDEIGHLAVNGRIHMHDLHATILHLLGLDHEQLTFRHAGRNFRLTDVHGRIIRDILA